MMNYRATLAVTATIVIVLVAGSAAYYISDRQLKPKPKPPPAGYTYVERRADKAALAAIRLPDNPSKEQVRAYVAEISKASEGQTLSSENDPQFAMLAAVGPANVDVLIEVVEDHNLWNYWPRVLLQLVTDEHKELILKSLPAHKELVRIVAARGWTADAHDTLLAVLAGRPRFLPQQWVVAVASFQDPATYPDLIAHFRQCGRPDLVYGVIRSLPGIYLIPTVDQIWQEAAAPKGSYPDWLRLGIARMAVDAGNMDALNYLVEHIEEKNSSGKDHPRDVILQYTPATGPNEQIRQWFDDNKGRIVFDREAGKFKTQ